MSLATYRRSGAEVATPVWIAEADGRYYVFSEGGAGKVKRLRVTARARIAACDYRGVVRSRWLDAHGTVVTDARVVDRAYKALRRKYGWQMMLADVFSKLTGRYGKRAMIELEIAN